MAPRKLFACGWRGDSPRFAGLQASILPPSRVKEALRPCPEGVFLLLGPRALEELSPEWLRRLIHEPYVLVLCVAQSSRTANLDAWRAAGFKVASGVQEVAVEVTAMTRRRPRVEIPLESWVPARVAEDPILCAACKALPDREQILVSDLNSAIAKERHYSTRRLNGNGESGKSLCLAYIREYRDSERARGVPLNWIALVLGYSRGSNMEAALKRGRTRGTGDGGRGTGDGGRGTGDGGRGTGDGGRGTGDGGRAGSTALGESPPLT